MKIIHKYCLLLGNNINYKGNILKRDIIIELIENKDKNIIKSIARVNKCKMIKMNLTKEGIIELLFQKLEKNNYIFAKTKIILRIYEFEGKCSMYIFFYFLNNQSNSDIDNFTKRKNKELAIFKDIVENYEKNNNYK